MAHTINERPPAFCLSKNELRYVYTLTDLSRAGLELQIKLFYVRKSDNANVQIGGNFNLKPDANGKVYFYFNAYIDSLLTYNMPANSLVNECDTQYTQFFVHTREVWDADVTEAFNEHEESKMRVALKMGVEKHRYSRNNFFNYFDANKCFFTWVPTNRFVFVNQPNYLTVFIPSGNTDGLKVRVAYTKFDGTRIIFFHSIAGLEGYLFHLNVNPVTLGIIASAAGDLVQRFTVSILDAADQTIINPFTFFIDYTPLYNYYDLLYFNSLGGVDSIRVTGKVNSSFDIQSERAEGGFSLLESSVINKNPDTIATAIAISRKYKGDAGWCDHKQQQLAFIELFASACIFQKIDGRNVRVLNVSTTVDTGEVNDDMQSLPVEWTLAETNDVLTPLNISLGLAADTETYP